MRATLLARSATIVTLVAVASCANPVQRSINDKPADKPADKRLLPGRADVPDHMRQDQMASLRLKGWNLFTLVEKQREGMPDPSYWQPWSVVMRPLALHVANPSLQQWVFSPAEEQKNLRTTAAVRPLYQSTFFNSVAAKYIRDNQLYDGQQAKILLQNNIRDLAFPTGSAALKTFWYRLSPGEKLDVKVWDWRRISKIVGVDALPDGTLDTQCAEIMPSGTGCLKTADAFYTATVSDPAAFRCDGCDLKKDVLKKDDLLVLVALHIASKQMPDWIWATFWWRGKDSPETSGSYWTCGDSQRREAIGDVIDPWKNYSMDVTAGFKYAKPQPDDSNHCGAPGAIGNGEEYFAAYNPFVEALFENGRKSSCIECHARASTDGSASRMSVPAVNSVDKDLLVSSFEGFVRTDYMWSLPMGSTLWPPVRWP